MSKLYRPQPFNLDIPADGFEELDSSIDNGVRHFIESIIHESQDGRCACVT